MSRKMATALFLLAAFALGSLPSGYGSQARRKPATAQKEKGQNQKKAAPEKKEPAKGEAEKKPKPRDPAIEDLLRQALLCPPEFAAHAMIRLAGSGRLDPDWKREVLEEAFNLAAGAPEPVKRVAIYVTGTSDTRPRLISNGYQLGLDALSLKCKAVREMLTVDQKKALELFKRIEPPKVRPVECEEIFIPEPTAYYETLAEVARTSFTPKQVGQNEVASFLQPHIYAMTSPVQVTPVIELLMRVPLPREQTETLLGNFASALGKISGDDNAFTHHEAQVFVSVYRLQALYEKQGIARDDLFLAYRAYLVNHLSGSRCAAGPGTKTPRLEKQLAERVRQFNETFRLENAAGGKAVWPISDEEAKPAEVRGYAEETMLWTTPRASEFMARFKAMRFANRPDRPVYERKSQAEKESEDWQADYRKYLGELMAWDGTGEKSEADHFHQTWILLLGMVGDAPNAELRHAALEEMYRLVSESPLYRESRLEWYGTANAVVRRAYVDKGQEKLFKQLKESSNPVLSVYAKLEEVAPGKAEKN